MAEIVRIFGYHKFTDQILKIQGKSIQVPH